MWWDNSYCAVISQILSTVIDHCVKQLDLNQETFKQFPVQVRQESLYVSRVLAHSLRLTQLCFCTLCMHQLIKTLGSWPVTSDTESGVWNDASWDLEEALSTAHLYKSFPFFATAVGVDDKNSSSYVIIVRSDVLMFCTLFHCTELCCSRFAAFWSLVIEFFWEKT